MLDTERTEFTQVYDDEGGRQPQSGGLSVLLVSRGQGAREYRLADYKKEEISIGRSAEQSDIVLSSSIISSSHVKFLRIDGSYYLQDDHSTNGTFMLDQGQYVKVESNVKVGPLQQGMIFILGGNRKAVDPAREPVLMIIKQASGAGDSFRGFPLTNDSYMIGRSRSCDIVIPHPAVSRQHAVIYRSQGRYAIQDKQSRNGVFVNGRRLIQPIFLQEKDVIMIAGKLMVFSCNMLFLNMASSGIEIGMSHLFKKVDHGKKTILTDVNCRIRSNEFVAIIGGSGAGKSTLLKILGGYDQFFEGDVAYNGVSLNDYYHLLKNIIGYVPQEDIVYENLKLYKMLKYAAKLKMPDSTSKEEIEDRIQEVLSLVEMEGHQDKMIKDLSGGQKKRASIAVELLADPAVFFLDEPTSGLDPGTEKKLMTVLHHLAKDQGKTIIMVTHTTQSLDLCDRIIFMGKRGRLTFFGSPEEAKQFFHTDDLIDIYNIVDDNTETWASEFERRYHDENPRMNRNADRLKKPKTQSAIRQFATLSARYAELVKNDKMRLLLMLLQPLLIPILLFIVADRKNIFLLYEPTNQILFTYACSAIWMGIFNTIQEICKERAILKREYMSNLRLSAYVLSKYVVQLIISFVQAFLFTGIFLVLIHNSHMPAKGMIGPFVLEMFFTTWLTIFASSSMGLIVSSMMKSPAWAMAISPFLLIIQLLFSGVLFELDIVSKVISAFTTSRWSVSAMGIITNIRSLDSKFYRNVLESGIDTANIDKASFPVDSAKLFIHTPGSLLQSWGMLLLFIVIFGMLCVFFLQNVSKDR